MTSTSEFEYSALSPWSASVSAAGGRACASALCRLMGYDTTTTTNTNNNNNDNNDNDNDNNR